MTCDRCMDGRHVRCRRDGCTCTMCAAPQQRPHSRVSAASGRSRARAARPVRAAGPPAKRQWPKKPGPVPGAHGLRGRSSLPKPMQAAVEAALADAESISSIARRSGASRDQVRTIRQRQEALASTNHGGTQ